MPSGSRLHTVRGPDIGRIRAQLSWFRSRLLRWFGAHGRNYPWRTTQDPYLVLVAEMMLRRTRAEQVLPVYSRFVQAFPRPDLLNAARRRRVRALLRSLGLPARADELLAIADKLCTEFRCTVPSTRSELKELPGVGDYVAGAVLSVGFKKPEWAVDTNVVRVLGRFFALPIHPAARRSPLVLRIAADYARSRVPHKANLALLDLGALVCRNPTPLCTCCPVRGACAYLRSHPELATPPSS